MGDQDTNSDVNDNTNTSEQQQSKEVHWKDQLGDLANNDRVKSFGTIKELAEAYVSSPTLPKIPKSHEDYTLPNTVKVKGLRKMAHEYKLSQEQLNGVLNFNADLSKIALEEDKTNRKKAIDTLKSEWGDDYEKNLKEAQKALKSYDEDGSIAKMLVSSGVANDPNIVKFLHKLSKTTGEGGFIDNEGNVRKKSASLASRVFPNHKEG